MFKSILLNLLLLATSYAFNQEAAISKEKKQQILNDIDSLISEDCLFFGHGPEPTDEEKRIVKVLEDFQLLEVEDLIQLQDSENKYVRVIAFGILALKAPEKASDTTLAMYSDTSTVWACTPKGPIKSPFTVRDIALKTLEEAFQRKKEFEKDSNVTKAIEVYIQKYAKYPETYRSISFSDFTVRKTIGTGNPNRDKITGYTIRHKYSLKDKSENTFEIEHYFKLNEKFDITMIEEELSGTHFEMPPVTLSDWSEKFGRKLKKNEIEEIIQRLNENSPLPEK